MAKTQTRTVLLTSGTNAGGATTRSAVLDCTAVDGGIITLAIANGGTAPTLQCEARIMVAHKQGSAPTAAAEGTGDTDWKQAYVIGGGTTINAKTRTVYRFGPEIAYAYIEFTGNTVQSVTVEAHATTYAY